ncbi:glycosyl transferase family 2 (plasmid) [Herpetosiphon aurantiacus DSM 785]|uniref:Glycosyl transferase family 2 n=1 Tax=Herpetosiphon aurantiacus (strain ATCC 23779 / DSM 785 / 114-95) TaxID=316274 RepID=A9B8R2_HERA2|nr:glycosyl transferase family 2 [Herpetosiphon aurantiacus DSM 785]
MDCHNAIVHPTVALIPAFNESRFIGSLVLAAKAYVDIVLVVDDGSTDHTVAIAQKAGACVLQHAVNQGKAAAVNTGFRYIATLNPFAVVMLDGDGQHKVDDIPALLAPICQGHADVVIGSRYGAIHSDIPLYRKVGQMGLTSLTNLISGVQVSDSQSGFRAFSAHAIAVMSFTANGGFSIESEMQFHIHEQALRICEVPIHVLYVEKAKRNPIGHGMQVVKGILGIATTMRPLLFWCGSGFATLMISTALLVFLAAHTTMALSQFAWLLSLLMIGMLLSIGSIGTGIILQRQRVMLQRMETSLKQQLMRAPSAASNETLFLTPRERVYDGVNQPLN